MQEENKEVVPQPEEYTVNIPQPTEVSGNGTISMPTKDIPADPRLIRKIAKMLRDRQPKHENYRECRKHCKNFKANRCFVLDANAQMECWKSWHDENGKPTKEAPEAVQPEIVE